MKKNILILLFLICASAKAQTLAEKLKLAYSKFSSDEQLKYASVSLSVLSTETGKSIFMANENLGLAPASTLKVLTSATALAVLGDDYKCNTSIAYSGKISEGILKGDLIVKGSGDPTLGSERWKTTSKEQVLEQILFALQKAGVKKIEGNVIGDDAIWNSQSLPQGWIWQDIGNYYGAATSALCWGENQFEVNFTAGKSVGNATFISNKQELYPFLNIINEVTTGNSGSGDNVYGYSSPYSTLIYLKGTYGIDLKKSIKFSMPDPALAMAYDLQSYLNKKGISSDNCTTSRLLKIQGKVIGNAVTTLHTLYSPPFKEIIYYFNQKSINLYGEQLIRKIGEQNGNNDINKGVSALQNYWAANSLRINKNSLNILDGSGLSPANRVTTLSLAQVLAFAKKQTWFPAYYASIPNHNNMKMKSGTIGDVLAYAGYAGNNQELCFSLIVNNYNGSTSQIRDKMFTLLNALK